jgi:hypothetical protein
VVQLRVKDYRKFLTDYRRTRQKRTVHNGANRTSEAALQYRLRYEVPGKLRSLYQPLTFDLQISCF